MKFAKGNKASVGRPPGSKDIKAAEVKALMLAAIGAVNKDPEANLIAWATANPSNFWPLAFKVIVPAESKSTVTHKDGDLLSNEQAKEMAEAVLEQFRRNTASPAKPGRVHEGV